jgi:hypothetical protein
MPYSKSNNKKSRLSFTNLKKIISAIIRQPIRSLLSLIIPNKWHLFDAKTTEPKSRNLVDVNEIVEIMRLSKFAELVTIDSFIASYGLELMVKKQSADTLRDLFDHYGSDKSSNHNYERIYQPIITSILDIKKKVNISEIGLGTYSLSTPSNMGIFAKPGASAFAFTKFSDQIKYLGGDIDKKILFTGERIQTQWVNQMDRQSLRNFLNIVEIDLVIDDGLHAPQANINTILEFLEIAQSGAWIVTEDIDFIFQEFWLQLIPFLQTRAKCELVATSRALVFVAKKI